jgi:hypothetical protein
VASNNRGIGLIGGDAVTSSKLFSEALELLSWVLEIIFEVLDFVL